MNNEHKNTNNVLTIFSAPNYCDRYNNLGAVGLINENKIDIDTFKYIEHPYVLPNNVNIFEWSINLISTEICKIFMEIMKSELIKKQKIVLEPIQKIRQKIELFEQIQTFNKLIKQKKNKDFEQIQNKCILDGNEIEIQKSLKFSNIKKQDLR